MTISVSTFLLSASMPSEACASNSHQAACTQDALRRPMCMRQWLEGAREAMQIQAQVCQDRSPSLQNKNCQLSQVYIWCRVSPT